MKQYYDKNNDKWTVKRLDSKSDIKRKYKLIIEEEYISESDSPHDIEKIINAIVNILKNRIRESCFYKIPTMGILKQDSHLYIQMD